MTRILLISTLLVGVVWCAQQSTIVFNRGCISEVKLKEAGKCWGPDQNHLTCTGLLVTLDPSCGHWEVKKK